MEYDVPPKRWHVTKMLHGPQAQNITKKSYVTTTMYLHIR
jgi:hypothetical protein